MEKRKIQLTEEKLREFVSYSVARILKEAMGRPIYDKNGEYDGSEDSKYGSDSTEIEFDPYEDDGMMAAFDSVLDNGKYQGLSKDMFDDYEDGQYGRIFPVSVKVFYDTKEGMKGDGYLQPDDPDEINVTGWKILSDLSKFGPAAELVNDVVSAYFKDGYFNTENLENGIAGLYEENSEEGPVVDNFPKKASGTFTMNTRRGNTDKYRAYVEKTDDEELLTDIFIYDPMDKEWYPQAEYVVGIEEYTNGTWLPYWETFNGDVSIKALANCFGKVVKLWKKVGYLYDEDDEIPFRYGGDYMKGAPKGMF